MTVATHFPSTCQANLITTLPAFSSGVSVFGWYKFINSGFPGGATQLAGQFWGAANSLYQNFGFFCDASNIYLWDETAGQTVITTNNGDWVFLLARQNGSGSSGTMQAGFTRTAGAALSFPVNYTYATATLEGTTMAFLEENNPLDGDVEYAGVVPRMVTNTEAQSLSNNKVSPNSAWAFWPFENASVADISGNGRNWNVSDGAVTSASTNAPLLTSPNNSAVIDGSGAWENLIDGDIISATNTWSQIVEIDILTGSGWVNLVP
jgi:hypothetical protein